MKNRHKGWGDKGILVHRSSGRITIASRQEPRAGQISGGFRGRTVHECGPQRPCKLSVKLPIERHEWTRFLTTRRLRSTGRQSAVLLWWSGPHSTSTDFLPLLEPETLGEDALVLSPWMLEIETSQGAVWAVQGAVQRSNSMVSLVVGQGCGIRPRLV